MANLAIQPGVIEFFDTLTKAGGVELAVEEVVVTTASPLAGKSLVEAQNILSYGAMIVALKRAGGLIPGSRLEARIEAGDTVTVVGVPEQLAAVQQKNSAQL